MKKTIIFKAMFMSMALASLASCYDMDDMSKNPYELPDNTTGGGEEQPGEEDKTKYADINIDYKVSKADTLALKSELSSANTVFRNFLYEGFFNDYQITTNLSHDIYAGFVANNQPKHAGQSPDYFYKDGWSGRRWAHFYNDRSSEYRTLLRVFKFNENTKKYKNLFYATRIYYAFLALANTDTYGDMPFKEYVQAKIPETNNVAYNTQAEVYDAMFRMLEQAVDSIKPNDATQIGYATDDICYHGDWNKWLRFANSLRLRMALRISNVDPARAKQEAQNALNNEYGLMQSNDDNMQIVPKYAPVSQGGTDDGGNEHPLVMCSVCYNGESVMSKDLENFYRNASEGGAEYKIKTGRNSYTTKKIDPRCLVSWYRGKMTASTLETGEDSQREDFVGCERGAQAPVIDMGILNYSLTRTAPKSLGKNLNPNYFFSRERAYLLLGYAESEFLKAEAVLRGWAGMELTGTVEDYYKSGIKASMDYYGIANDKAQAYIDGEKALTGKVFEGSDKEKQLEAIITQKWMAIFPNGNEGWAEFRRTDYPVLANQLTNNSGGDVPMGKNIKRILYPYSENSNSYFTSHPELLQVNTQGKRLWWDVADTNDDSGNRVQPNNFR